MQRSLWADRALLQSERNAALEAETVLPRIFAEATLVLCAKGSASGIDDVHTGAEVGQNVVKFGVGRERRYT